MGLVRFQPSGVVDFADVLIFRRRLTLRLFTVPRLFTWQLLLRWETLLPEIVVGLRLCGQVVRRESDRRSPLELWAYPEIEK